jgi:hypothetical protein
MPSEKRNEIALQAIRAQIDRFRSALSVTSNQVKALLSGPKCTEDDQTVALGLFAKDKVNSEKFASFTAKNHPLDVAAEVPISAAQEVLISLLSQGDKLFIIDAEKGSELGHQLSVRLASIGRAFAAARIIDLAKNGAYKEDKHAVTLKKFPYALWNSSERALAPGLLVKVSGFDFKPSSIVPLLDTNMKIVFCVSGDAPAAALSRVISPGVFVQQETGETNLDGFAAFKGIAIAALLPPTAVSFVHDPSAGTTTYQRFTSITFPNEVKKRVVGGISSAQQSEDYGLLECLSVPPDIAGEATADPAGKLSAWLLHKTDLSSLSQ